MPYPPQVGGTLNSKRQGVLAERGARRTQDPGLLERLGRRDVPQAFIAQILEAFRTTDHRPQTTTEHTRLDSRPSSVVVGQDVRGPSSAPEELYEPLTDRELQVLSLLAQRHTYKEIAAQLFISPGTVRQHTYQIYQKLDVHNRRKAVAKAQTLGILPPT